jgi:hypothetical protein
MANAEMTNTIMAIQGLLANTSLEWHMEYEPQDKSWHFDIREKEGETK